MRTINQNNDRVRQSLRMPSSPASRLRKPSAPGWFYAATVILTFAMMLLISDQFLSFLNIHYALKGGSYFSKLHISTYLIWSILLCYLFRFGNPIDVLMVFVRARPVYIGYFATTSIVAIYLLVLQGVSNVAFMMDTLLRPVGVALLVFSLAPKHRRIVFFVTLGVITLNSIIGITESILVSRLIPYKIHGFSITEDFFRSTALLGHPLSNALITAVGLIFALGYLRSNVARIIIGAILITGLLSFGGCTALAAALLSVFLMLAIGVVQDLRNGHFKYGESALLAVALLVAPFLISVMVGSTNIGSRIIGYLRWGASADARLESLNLFQYISMDDLIFGMPVERLGEMTNDIGTIGTIENFWVVLIARMGLIGFGIFFIALAAFCYRLMQEGKLAAKVAVIMFLFIASSNNSLSSKSPALCVLVLLIVSGASYLQNRSIRGNGADKKGSKSLPRGFRSQQTAGTRRPRSNPNLRPTS